jgi:2',5'-phosphodiesterase
MQRNIRVTTYNVLSSSLCSPSYFINVTDEKWCSSKYRLDGLLKKLRTEIDNKAIICLQEVSLAWTGKLHSFLDSNDYTFVVSNYGTRFNGFVVY